MCYSHLWNWMQVLWSRWSHYSREGVGEGLGVSWLQKVIRLDILSNAAHKTDQTPAIFNILGTGIPLWYRYLIYNSAFLTSPMFLLTFCLTYWLPFSIFGFIYPWKLNNNIFLNLKKYFDGKVNSCAVYLHFALRLLEDEFLGDLLKAVQR